MLRSRKQGMTKLAEVQGRVHVGVEEEFEVIFCEVQRLLSPVRANVVHQDVKGTCTIYCCNI